MRVVLVSTTEGEDKPLKYPTIFSSADLTIVTKLDLAAAVEFDFESLKRNVHQIRPSMPVLCVSAKNFQGIRELEEHLLSIRAVQL